MARLKLAGLYRRRLLFLICIMVLLICGSRLFQDNSLMVLQQNNDEDIFVAKQNETNDDSIADYRKYGKLKTPCLIEKSGKRLNVILFGHGRSGTSFLGQLFNQNPEVLYLFEPLKAVENMSNEKMLDYLSEQTKDYVDNVHRVLSAIFKCDFLESAVVSDFLERYSGSSFSRKQSNALQKLQFDLNLDAAKMNELCRALPNYTVVKLLIPRLPNGNIVNLLPLMRRLNQSEFKVIHIIRDPRAVMSSQASLGWFNKSTYGKAAQTICTQTKAILEAEESHDTFFHCNYKLITYEELVTKPLRVARELYTFLGMTSSPEVTRWIDDVTTLSRTDPKQGEKWRFSQIQNTTLALNKWKSVSRKSNLIVEKECDEVLTKIGYKKIA